MEIFHAGTALAFYPYGLGHHMGLEVHDVVPPLDANKAKKTKDQRFPKVQRAYRAFANKHGSQYRSKRPSKDLQNFSIDPSRCLAPNVTASPALAPGMVVTIEPGIYFNKFVLETFYLNDPVHTKFIDNEALERYMPVGGVRIEDDILITKDGYENLTTAPKGEKMLQIIREGPGDCKREKT
jgi:Xaa-Pro dipeptidase